MEKKNCRFLRFSQLSDERGSLAAIEGGDTVPFEIHRVFFLYDFSPATVRGQHATMNDQCIVTAAGTCRIRTHDGEKETVFTLDAPMCGLYIPAMVWREIYDCSADCVLAVLSDKHYDPNDYVRDFEQFLQLSAAQKQADGC